MKNHSSDKENAFKIHKNLNMNNEEPFNTLLDMYATECCDLYKIVGTMFKYPGFENPDYIEERDVVEGKLYSLAFACISSNYLQWIIESFYRHEDFDSVVSDMNFISKATEIHEIATTLNIDTLNTSFKDLVTKLIITYKRKIFSDIETFFPDISMQKNLFASIFEKENYYSRSIYSGADFNFEFGVFMQNKNKTI